ncbi:palmitoyl-monogalactosyldiacylglycerol delta-7 desaturase, chloroplastic [Olea europaea subsp. europaea]|nr:palmitoyl-monogalactosyldiacylglycerol delta-7 desaturase, chloroplastic [Olea europaea subsp. europaea]
MALLALPSLSLSGLHPATPKPVKTTIIQKHQESVIYARNIRLPHNSLNYGVKRKVGNDTTKIPIVNRAPEYEKDQNFGKILLPDVVVKRRNVFWSRKWNFWDVFSLGWIVSIHLLCLFAPFTFNWGAFWVAIALCIVTGLLGITLSYHRHLSHRSFKIPKWLEYFFAYCGVLAGQRDPIFWVSTHRYHHQFCDSEKDPHSPIGGFWFSHICWIFDTSSIVERCGEPDNVGDLEKQPFYKFIQSTYIIHLVAPGALLYSLGGLPYFVWGLGVRLAFVYHITWLVNSACHVWGKQAWNTGDFSKNNWWVAVLSFGEGWHNNHHAFQYSARQGLEWWQIDMTWYVIRFLEAIGLATDVKLPTSAQKQRMALTTEGN